MGYHHTKAPELVFRGDKAVAVILDIEEYQAMLEALEDLKDLKYLAEARNQSPSFRRLEDILAEQAPHV